ncbi:mdis1-interacting receptor like kinase 2 [Quercus suber]|uniref:Mdis1-interacting receptor like kinase 2 n=1 Tax=Quercus suber TaxID=58331 RepID=A0AAW0J5T4_QUESU
MTTGYLTNLVSLFLSSNQINSSIPHEIANMTNLTKLYLNNNNIVGQIPSTVGHLNNLTQLDLSWNQISGSIPLEIANCSFLGGLSLSHNYLNGSVPSWIIEAGTCSQYGIMMTKLHMKTALKQQRILTLDIVLEQVVMVVFTKHNCLAVT